MRRQPLDKQHNSVSEWLEIQDKQELGVIPDLFERICLTITNLEVGERSHYWLHARIDDGLATAWAIPDWKLIRFNEFEMDLDLSKWKTKDLWPNFLARILFHHLTDIDLGTTDHFSGFRADDQLITAISEIFDLYGINAGLVSELYSFEVPMFFLERFPSIIESSPTDVGTSDYSINVDEFSDYRSASMVNSLTSNRITEIENATGSSGNFLQVTFSEDTMVKLISGASRRGTPVLYSLDSYLIKGMFGWREPEASD